MARGRAARRNGRLFVGTSGYQYEHWRGRFYPRALPRAQWFAWYARHFDTVEINATFYRLPAPEVFDAWRRAAPPNMTYALKFSRFGTHVKRLRDPEQPVALFLERARRLGSTLGPILVQLPPRWRVNLERLRGFLAALPRSRRWALEFRDASWLAEPVYALLAKYRVALCVHDLLPAHPRRVTADFTYLRFHGNRYGGSYPRAALVAHARRIGEWLADGTDVYAYFNNDIGGHAVRNALDLRRYAGAAARRAAA